MTFPHYSRLLPCFTVFLLVLSFSLDTPAGFVIPGNERQAAVDFQVLATPNDQEYVGEVTGSHRGEESAATRHTVSRRDVSAPSGCLFPPPLPEHVFIFRGPDNFSAVGTSEHVRSASESPKFASGNTTVDVRCHAEFKGTGSGRLQCNQDLQWQFLGPPLVCERIAACRQLVRAKEHIRRHNLQLPHDSQLTVPLNATIRLVCLSGYELTSPWDTLRCEKRTRDGSLVLNDSLPRCKRKVCQTCDILGNGLIMYHGFDGARAEREQLINIPRVLPVNNTLSVGCQFCSQHRRRSMQNQYYLLGAVQRTIRVTQECSHTVQQVTCGETWDGQHRKQTDFVVIGNSGARRTLKDLARTCFHPHT